MRRYAPIFVTLDEEATACGVGVGTKRQEARIAAGSVHTNGRPRDDAADMLNHQTAACEELAGYIGLEAIFWNAVGDIRGKPKQPDLDDIVDVKGRRQDRHRLIVKRDEPANWIYVSVCSERKPIYTIDGWCWGFEIKTGEFWSTNLAAGRPAYACEMGATIMKDPRELKVLLAERRARPRLYA
jgi:hypothetical protein